jgi:hypothetical protein
MDLKKPTLHEGKFAGTDGNGTDHYGPDYYLVSEVDAYITAQKNHRIHVDIVGEEINKLRRLLNRSYEMISKLMPGIGGLVIDIGELNSLMIAIKLAKDNPPPETPVKHGRIFGGT